ncbi:MAG: preprotein translocase subunit SecG [Gammaproteobacteria bacterium]
MKIFLLSITVISSLLMVGAILLQQGKGAGLGSSFGGGARGGLYEAPGKANFLTRTTSFLATIFLASSLALSLYLGSGGGVLEELRRDSGVLEELQRDPETPQDSLPAEPAPPPEAAEEIPE